MSKSPSKPSRERNRSRKQPKHCRKSDHKSNQRSRLLSDDLQHTLTNSRRWLRDNETRNIQSRYGAFQETLLRLQSMYAKGGATYEKKQLEIEDIKRYVAWVSKFRGVIVGREYLDVCQKKSKSWADQHRAQNLGKKFFVRLLDELDEFVKQYSYLVNGITREHFLQQCVVKLLKRTFSPAHKQAGDTLLVCDQAVKSGPTRVRLERLLAPFDVSQAGKGRDVVECLEAHLLEDHDDDDDDDHSTEDVVMSDGQNSGAMDSPVMPADALMDVPPPVVFQSDDVSIPRVYSHSSEDGSMTDHSLDSNTVNPQDYNLDWTLFPQELYVTEDSMYLKQQNLQLKHALSMYQQQMQHFVGGGFGMQNGLFPVNGLDFSAPQQMGYQADSPMIDTGSVDVYYRPQGFSLTPQGLPIPNYEPR